MGLNPLAIEDIALDGSVGILCIQDDIHKTWWFQTWLSSNQRMKSWSINMIRHLFEAIHLQMMFKTLKSIQI